uniref:Uncharacterized protein n=1 Tax=Helianthus annuus TaxID=4232 RepID=A0A251S880_HELAN
MGTIYIYNFNVYQKKKKKKKNTDFLLETMLPPISVDFFTPFFAAMITANNQPIFSFLFLFFA